LKSQAMVIIFCIFWGGADGISASVWPPLLPRGQVIQHLGHGDRVALGDIRRRQLGIFRRGLNVLLGSVIATLTGAKGRRNLRLWGVALSLPSTGVFFRQLGGNNRGDLLRLPRPYHSDHEPCRPCYGQ
jgi:hypothetical protein